MSKRRNKKRSIPLAPPPAIQSRKKARVVTTLFHRYTRQRQEALEQGDVQRVQEYDAKIEEMGGRQEYQRASQLSTSHHSTTKWVIGKLGANGWLYGIPLQTEYSNTKLSKKKNRRMTRILEVGAINKELLNAAKETISADGNMSTKKYRLHVRAIDLHSSHEGIEEADFLTFPLLHKDPAKRYDVVVCSMVINCVPTPEQRGTMLALLFHQLRPGGLLFLTLPKLCLTQSPFTTSQHFMNMLTNDGVGFELQETKESPKVSFFILKRPLASSRETEFNPKWTTATRINKGKKYRNTFSVILNRDEVNGVNLFHNEQVKTV
jgi:25S rRNA (adenine2142-N1)-methyltransferase